MKRPPPWRTSLRALCVGATLTSALFGGNAHADDSKEAMERFDRGVVLYQAGSYEGALLEFEATYKLSGNYRVLFNIGLCRMESRDPVGALAAFRRYLAEGGEKVEATKRANVEALTKKLEMSVASLVVKSDAPAGTEVRIDDERVGALPLSGPLVVKVGRRKVSLVTGERRVDKIVDVVSGESPAVSLSLPAIEATSRSRAEPQKVATDPSDGPGALWVPWALAGAFGATSAVTGVLASSARNDAAMARATFGATQSDIDSPDKKATTFAAATDVLLGATVVATGIATYFTIRWVTRPEKASTAASTTRLALVPAGPGLRLQGEF